MPFKTETAAPVADLDVKAIGDDGTFEGYASVWGVRDSHREIVQKGAFTASLAKRPAAKVRMLYQHDQGQPIGVWTSIEEDERGLKVKGKLVLETERARETHALLKAGALDGLSIGFRTIRDRKDRAKNARILEEIDLWEVSLVTFGSNPESTVSSVKSTSFSELVDAINGTRDRITKAIQ